MVFVTDPGDIKRMFAADPEVLRGGESSSVLEPFAGPHSILLADGQFGDAISEIEKGRDRISEFFQQSAFPELEAKSSEIAFLDEWLEEVRAKRPLSKLEVMEREMERAIQGERYERAAELRDMLSDLKRTTRKTEKFERIPYSLPLAIDPARDFDRRTNRDSMERIVDHRVDRDWPAIGRSDPRVVD